MTLLLPPRFLGKPTVQHPANIDRLGTSGLLQPGLVTAGAAVAIVGGARGGALAGPANTMGELSLPNNGTVQVQPARWFIPGTQDTRQGTYEVTNDAVTNLAVAAQDATLFRRAYVVVYVRDSFVAGGANDDAVLTIINGPLAASNPAFPTVPDNALVIGELYIPPSGQSVTLTPYNPRTGLRHGITPVTSADTVAGSYVGQYRDHPTLGTQRWNGSAWLMVGSRHVLDAHLASTNGSIPVNAWTPLLFDAVTFDPFGGFSGGSYIAPFTGWFRATGTIVYMPSATGTRLVQWQRTVGAPVSGSPMFVRGTAAGSPGTSGINTPVQSSYSIFCNKGERLTLTGYQNSGGTLAVSGSPSGTDQVTAMTIDLLEQTA